MSPFKEPQPRKQPADAANGWAETVKKNVASMTSPEPWSEEKLAQVQSEGVWTMSESEFKRELDAAVASGRAEGASEALKDFHLTLDASRADLEYRKAALDLSVRYWGNGGNADRTSNNVVHVATKFEAYLREGKQP